MAINSLTAKLGAGIIVTDTVAEKSNKVQGVVLIDPITGLPIGMAGAVTQQVTIGQVTSLNVSIANGASSSADIDLGVARLNRIDMPAAWTAANLTFLTSSDNITWRDLYDKAGVEYSAVAAASRSIIVPLDDMLSVRYLRIRSGTSAVPVIQLALRTLILSLIPR